MVNVGLLLCWGWELLGLFEGLLLELLLLVRCEFKVFDALSF